MSGFHVYCAQGTASGASATFSLCDHQVAVVGEAADSVLVTRMIEIVQTTVREAESVVDFLLQSNQRMYELENVHPPEMTGTSLIAAESRGNHVVVAHTGGCQAWLFRDREVRRLSSDQSLAMEVLINTGSIEEYEELCDNAGDAVSAVLGLMPAARVDVRYEPSQPRDRVVLVAGGATLGHLGHAGLVEAAKYENASQIMGVFRQRATNEDWAAAVLGL